jgi:glycosyltransferase involved in cell wall biosynthesis
MRIGRTLLTVINDRPYFERHRRHVAEAAARAGWRSVVAMPASDNTEADPYPDWCRVDFRASRIAPLQDAKSLAQLMQLLAREEPDLVHAITLKAISLTGLALQLHRARTGRRIPLVATFPGLGYTFMEQSSPTFRDRLRRIFAMAGCRLAAAWPDFWATFETDHDRSQIVGSFGVPFERTIVIQGTGLNLSTFAVDDKNFDEPLTLLFAGRLLRSKGVSAFLDAAHLPGASQFRWLIAGWRYESPDALTDDEVEALRYSRHVEFLGAVSDMPALLRKTHALVMPSTYPEGIPRILIEAAAASIPMITTDFPGARELVQHDDTGFILKEASGATILKAAQSLAALPGRGKAMGLRARELVRSGGFDSASVQGEFLNVYEAAVHGRPLSSISSARQL